jgi:hypothetical protein
MDSIGPSAAPTALYTNVHGRPHRLPTSNALGSLRRQVPLHRPLFRALPWGVRVWLCLSRLQRIHIG